MRLVPRVDLAALRRDTGDISNMDVFDNNEHNVTSVKSSLDVRRHQRTKEHASFRRPAQRLLSLQELENVVSESRISVREDDDKSFVGCLINYCAVMLSAALGF